MGSFESGITILEQKNARKKEYPIDMRQNNPGTMRIVFDDHRLVANANLLPLATFALHLDCGNSSIITSTSAARQCGRTRASMSGANSWATLSSHRRS